MMLLLKAKTMKGNVKHGVAALKGKINPLVLLPAVALTLVILFVDLPHQMKRVGSSENSKAAKPEPSQ